MKQKTTLTAEKKAVHHTTGSFFEKENFMWMLGGAIVMIIGFLLMAGGHSDNPNVFDPNEVYSTTRITIAPIVILAGLTLEIFAIFRDPKKKY